MDDLKIIIDSLGDQNEEIDDDELMDIKEEIDSIDKDEYFELAVFAIRLGKPQILEYLMLQNSYTKEEIKKICDEVEKYERVQLKISEDSDEDEDIADIVNDYVKIIKSICKQTKQNKTKNTKY